MIDPATIPVRDWYLYGIELEVECRSCGLVRRLGAAQLVNRADVRADLPLDADKAAKLPLRCSNCGSPRPATRLVRG